MLKNKIHVCLNYMYINKDLYYWLRVPVYDMVVQASFED